MSLSSAMNSAVSALSSQSTALAMVSQNLANSGTTGYKTTDASFASLVSGSSPSAYSAGGVRVNSVSNMDQQGTLETSQTTTNMAINEGSGLFVVSDSASNGDTFYTRNGEFSIDKNGYLTNNGYYLQGWATNAEGDILGAANAASLSTIDTDDVTSIASGTTTMTLDGTLPADAAINDTFTSTVEIYDSLGTPANSTITWRKTGANTWSASYSNATSTDGAGTLLATAPTNAITITFNNNGTFASTNPAAATMTFSAWTTGAANSSIALDMGEAGGSNGLNQLTTGQDTLNVDLEYEQNGTGYGTVTGIEIESDGTVYANFDNDQRRAIYKVALSTFNNPNGLSALNSGVYQATSRSGDSTLRVAGTGGAGSIAGGMLEVSTVDTNQEYSNMIAAQQAYSAASQIMSTVKEMEETLLAAIR